MKLFGSWTKMRGSPWRSVIKDSLARHELPWEAEKENINRRASGIRQRRLDIYFLPPPLTHETVYS
jgi:hypothetical protein